jgi:hypothetical protein
MGWINGELMGNVVVVELGGGKVDHLQILEPP